MEVVSAAEVEEAGRVFISALVYDPESRLTYGVRVYDMTLSPKALRTKCVREAEALRAGEIPQDTRGLVRARDDLLG